MSKARQISKQIALGGGSGGSSLPAGGAPGNTLVKQSDGTTIWDDPIVATKKTYAIVTTTDFSNNGPRTQVWSGSPTRNNTSTAMSLIGTVEQNAIKCVDIPLQSRLNITTDIALTADTQNLKHFGFIISSAGSSPKKLVRLAWIGATAAMSSGYNSSGNIGSVNSTGVTNNIVTVPTLKYPILIGSQKYTHNLLVDGTSGSVKLYVDNVLVIDIIVAGFIGVTDFDFSYFVYGCTIEVSSLKYNDFVTTDRLGVPPSGDVGQSIIKASNDSGDVKWGNPTFTNYDDIGTIKQAISGALDTTMWKLCNGSKIEPTAYPILSAKLASSAPITFTNATGHLASTSLTSSAVNPITALTESITVSSSYDTSENYKPWHVMQKDNLTGSSYSTWASSGEAGAWMKYNAGAVVNITKISLAPRGTSRISK